MVMLPSHQDHQAVRRHIRKMLDKLVKRLAHKQMAASVVGSKAELEE
jgi:hypothetical protein